jgi:hypothetical protein
MISAIALTALQQNVAAPPPLIADVVRIVGPTQTATAHLDFINPSDGQAFVKEIIPAQDGKAFVEAWRDAAVANGLQDRWIVVCHEQAVEDSISGFNTTTLMPISPDSRIFMFDESNLPPSGIVVEAREDPFVVFWEKDSIENYRRE